MNDNQHICIHVCRLISVGSTTIEFCEQQFREKQGSKRIWNRGCYSNFCDVFGRNPFLWFLPIDNRYGDGLSFVTESTRLLNEGNHSTSYRGGILSSASSIRERDKTQFEPILEG
eukprot:GHVQ01004154.1.p1 GENE.GHVQ01004154.1~~GHVQ01004154.1.p1  ORF type:complete len:115 (+),score=7.66 GHVQ01004154.1:155-499(+)